MTRQQVISRPEGGSDIQMQLERKMARVIVRISGFGSQYFDDQKTVSNVRIYSEASGIADGNPTGSSTEIQPYAQGNGGQGSTYTALVVPGYGDSGARFIQLTDGEGSSLRVKGIPELEAGNSYTFNLVVGKNTIQVQSVIVQDWTTGEILAGGQAEEEVSVIVPATPLDNTTTVWTAGTYAVPAGGLTYSAAITVSGDVTLVLTDGKTLTLNKGISLASGATLTIEGNGTMNVNGTNGADINTQEMEASAESGTEAISGSGTVILTSGTLTATGGKGGNVNDYYPECKGGHGAAGISCTLIVNGGTVTATGGNGGSLTNGLGPMGVAGNGGAGISGALTVNGGTLTATGGDGGAKSNGPMAQAGTNGRGISSTWTAGTGITFSDSADGTTWTTNSGTSSTQKYVKAE